MGKTVTQKLVIIVILVFAFIGRALTIHTDSTQLYTSRTLSSVTEFDRSPYTLPARPPSCRHTPRSVAPSTNSDAESRHRSICLPRSSASLTSSWRFFASYAVRNARVYVTAAGENGSAMPGTEVSIVPRNEMCTAAGQSFDVSRRSWRQARQ